MKTKLFIAAMAAVAVIGCQKDIDTTHTEVADGPTAFLSVSLKAAGTMTKADDGPTTGNFEYGLNAENIVEKIDFYFFDAAGAAYSVGTTNILSVSGTDLGTNTKNEPNIEDMTGTYLVIRQSQVAPPAKMVAVINDVKTPTESQTLGMLEARVLEDLKNTTGAFIMSNSVYVDGNGAKMVATDITEENIFTTTDPNFLNYEAGDLIQSIPEGLTIDPIDIYVERVAAKVRVNGTTTTTTTEGDDGTSTSTTTATLFPVKDTTGNQINFTVKDPVTGSTTTKAIYAKVLGWDVTNNTDAVNLIKSLNTTYDLDFIWNNAAFFRSYWANTTDEPLHNLKFSDLINKNLNLGYNYYFENTKAAATSNGVDVDVNGTYTNTDGVNTTANNQASQLLVAAQLVDEDGAAINLAKWYGVMYTVDALKTAMVGTVAAKLYVETTAEGSDTKTYSTIGVDDVEFYQQAQAALDKRYEVFVTSKTGTTYYYPAGTDEDGNPVMTAYTADAAKAILDAIAPAQMWESGYTYYYKTISHFGTSAGIVRNHLYDITIDGVTGLGTPVYDPNHIITPEIPEDQDALNLAARINILSWHLVSQSVTLGE